MSTVRELKEHLESFKDDDVIAFDIWQVEDVEGLCLELGIDLSLEQMQDVIWCMDSNKDANDGLNWDLMEHYIQEVRDAT